MSASKLYRPSDRCLSAKLVPTFADSGCHVVSVIYIYLLQIVQTCSGAHVACSPLGSGGRGTALVLKRKLKGNAKAVSVLN
jgi:hypothetical protein